MAAGESKNHASNKNNTNRTRNQPSNQPARKARGRKTNGSQDQQTCAAGKAVIAPPEPVLYKLCKPGWSVIVERIPTRKARALSARSAPSRIASPVRCAASRNAAGAVEPLA